MEKFILVLFCAGVCDLPHRLRNHRPVISVHCGEWWGIMLRISKASQGYCSACHHEALVHEDYNGRCLPCACWDAPSVQHHHDINKSRLLPVKEGEQCPFCTA